MAAYLSHEWGHRWTGVGGTERQGRAYLEGTRTPNRPASGDSEEGTTTMHTPQTSKLWTVDDVAEYLGVPKKTLYRWRTEGYGPAGRRIGKHLRYRSADVVAWVDGLDSTVP